MPRINKSVAYMGACFAKLQFPNFLFGTSPTHLDFSVFTDCAVACKAVYSYSKVKSEWFSDPKKVKFPGVQEFVDRFYDAGSAHHGRDLQVDVALSDAYSGVFTFVNRARTRALVVHRGTTLDTSSASAALVAMNDLQANYNILTEKQTGNLQLRHKRLALTKNVLQRLHEDASFSGHIYLTGHSLGGNTAYEAMCDDAVCSKVHELITFNAFFKNTKFTCDTNCAGPKIYHFRDVFDAVSAPGTTTAQVLGQFYTYDSDVGVSTVDSFKLRHSLPISKLYACKSYSCFDLIFVKSRE